MSSRRFALATFDVHDHFMDTFQRLNSIELDFNEKPKIETFGKIHELSSNASSVTLDSEAASSAYVAKSRPNGIFKVTTTNVSASPSEEDEDESDYPPMRRVVFITLALLIAMFLVALDRTIVCTAAPRITDEFDSFGDIGWYGGAYMLTLCTFQLLYGRVYTYYNPKILFLGNLIIFEAGSVVCAVAQTSTTVILGRALAGLGSSGIFSGTIMLVTHIAPLRRRAGLMSGIGAMYGVGSAVGPLVGGVFTSDVSWRWCFYINLPIGAVAFVLLFFLLKIPQRAPSEKLSFWQQMKRLDPLGTAFFLPCMTCLLLALQWGGSSYAWSSWRIILVLTLFSILLVAFCITQYTLGELATVPPRIIKQRTVLAAILYAFSNGAALMLVLYYMPTWLQGVKGLSAVESGISAMPLVATFLLGSVSSGLFVSFTGYYNPPLLLSAVIMAAGAAILLLLTPQTARPVYLGLSTVFGFGLGLGNQHSALAAQAALPRRSDSTVGIALTFFAQTLAGAVFVCVGENVLVSRLISEAERLLPQGSTYSGQDVAATIIASGATELRKIIPAEYLPAVLEAFNAAVLDIWKVAIGVCGVSLLAALALEWRNVKARPVARGVTGRA